MEIKPIGNWIQIRFTKDDWKYGDAQRVIEYLKQLPKSDRNYSWKEKVWYALNTYKDAILQITQRNSEEDFDVDNWLNMVFPDDNSSS